MKSFLASLKGHEYNQDVNINLFNMIQEHITSFGLGKEEGKEEGQEIGQEIGEEIGQNNMLKAINMYQSGCSEAVILEKTQLTKQKLQSLIIALKH